MLSVLVSILMMPLLCWDWMVSCHSIPSDHEWVPDTLPQISTLRHSKSKMLRSVKSKKCNHPETMLISLADSARRLVQAPDSSSSFSIFTFFFFFFLHLFDNELTPIPRTFGTCNRSHCRKRRQDQARYWERKQDPRGTRRFEDSHLGWYVDIETMYLAASRWLSLQDSRTSTWHVPPLFPSFWVARLPRSTATSELSPREWRSASNRSKNLHK